MLNKYNKEGYFDPTAFSALSRIEHQEKKKKKRRSRKRKEPSYPVVYICSPYSGDTENNMEKARKYSRFAVEKGCLPITPHIYFTQFMNDDIPEERSTAVSMNLVLMRKCSELWVFGDVISKGMKAEIGNAKRKHIKIRHFSEDMEEKA
ncbi:MAG: DUF4406 domain-containing protein [Clostridium sp.]|nr:DUF4406 domain-containing protein [Clostridium sp.]